MSLFYSKLYALRAGVIDCACALPGTGDADGRSDRWRLSASFACAIIAQALLLTSLPIVGGMIAPSPALANLPYALTWLGAALASFPASILVDQFGRRAAFALGASTGLAGGLLAAWAAAKGHFAALCIGAIWLGIAQGFALFYRHAGATQQGRAQTILTVMVGGCVAAFLVPALVAFAARAYAPFTDCALLIFAGAASVAALPLILTLPHATAVARTGTRKLASRPFWIATALSTAAWGIMAHVMGAAPHALVDCGIGGVAIGGLISWHFLAMYAPLAVGARLRAALGTWNVALIAAALLAAALAYVPSNGALIEARLLAGGVGWSLAQIASAALLEKAESPTRSQLALHDTLIFVSALASLLAA